MNSSFVMPTVIVMLCMSAVNSASPKASARRAAFTSAAVAALVIEESMRAVMSFEERVSPDMTSINASTNSLAVICSVTLIDKIILTTAAEILLRPAATRIFCTKSSFELTEPRSIESRISISSRLLPANTDKAAISFSSSAKVAASSANRPLTAATSSASPPAIRFIKASMASAPEPTEFISMPNFVYIKFFNFSKS